MSAEKVIPFNVAQHYDIKEKIEVKHYFTQDEKESMRQELTDNILKLDRLADEKKEIINQYKGEMKPLETRNRWLKRDLKMGYSADFKECHGIKDYENSTVTFYDPQTGEEVHTRKMYPEERQLHFRG